MLDGTVGTIAGDEKLTAEAGTRLVKPGGEWDAFWNPGDGPCHMMGVVALAGFESNFDETAKAGGNLEKLARVSDTYCIDMDFESIPELCEQFALSFAEQLTVIPELIPGTLEEHQLP